MTIAQFYPTLKVTVEPSTEPVSLPEFKTFAQYEDTDQDDLMTSLLKAARRKVERDCDVALITQTRQLRMDEFPCESAFEIHLAPVSAVVITYEDTASATQTFSASNYTTDFVNLPPRVALVCGATWPCTADELGAVTVTVTAGYGAAAAVPEEAKTAIKLLAREWFYNRCPTGETGAGIDMAYGSLCDCLRWRPSFT